MLAIPPVDTLLSVPTAAHTDPVAAVVLALAVILVGAKLGGDLAVRLGQPAVLGELVIGIALGNLDLFGVTWFRSLAADPTLSILAQIGVVVLLFQVGLESTVRDMMKVGVSSFLVAVLGVATPFALGWGVGALLIPDETWYAHAFLGATLTATSVGITARVLADLGKGSTPEARVIVGAAVIDDVLGLVILAVVSGVIVGVDRGQPLSFGDTAGVVVKATVFLFGALGLGVVTSPRLFRFASRLRGRGVLLSIALAVCFVLAYLASAIGLATIVGAYAAGLILEDVHFKEFAKRGERRLAELVDPIASFLVPVFFVVMGLKVDLRAFARPEVLGLATLLIVAAIIGKQACSLGAVDPGLDRLSIGIGMVPRGEVGLIFASMGTTLTIAGQQVIDPGVFSAVVIMVVVTTLVTPPALAWSLTRGGR